ncbi:Upstream activation factor subunit spp27 [Acromyrmex echinatior]|uniref:Upstream activation factor subunit spp27 n=1 Tax=Acromyrmex echinatior TaxID=103372 RepID=F4X4C2_ACREC|nr:Upstream activation factor subunit spp27 [Acromyrmex echinatior]
MADISKEELRKEITGDFGAGYQRNRATFKRTHALRVAIASGIQAKSGSLLLRRDDFSAHVCAQVACPTPAIITAAHRILPSTSRANAILKDADLTTMSAKKVRQQIEEKLDVDLIERKKEVDDLVMECLQEKQDGGKKKKKAASEESEDGEEEEEEGSEEEEEEEEKKPAKRNPAKKAPNKRKKGSSEDEESASDDDASDEEYSPKKPKVTPKKSKPGKKGKKKGSDSDSDEDWGKNKKAPGSTAKKGAGGKGKGGGYTRAITLSPELAAVVGAEQMARHEVVKKVWSIIKERNLYDPKNKQFAICDEELMKVIGVKRFRTFGMMKYLKNHFVD